MKQFLIGALVLLYPVTVYFGLQWVQPSVIAIIMAVVILLRYWLLGGSELSPQMRLIGISAIVLFVFTAITNSNISLHLYPVLISLGFFSVFLYSIYRPPSIITQIASLRDSLSEEKVNYTVKVTKVWCGFFILNAGVAFVTVWLDNKELWLLYNGLVSYVLMGLLFAAEWLYRIKIKKYGN